MNISVVIPVRDDPDGLSLALEGLCQQEKLPDEVLVVDAGTDDTPAQVAKKFTDSLPLRLIKIGPAYPGRARNAGVKEARSDYVAFLDAGTRPRSGWLAALEGARTRAGDADVVFGSYVPRIKDDWDWAACATYLAPGSPPEGGRFPTTTSLMMTREAARKVGAQREDLRAGEDLLLFEHIHRLGLVTAQATDAIVDWEIPFGPWGHFRRLRLYSRAVLDTPLWQKWHRAVFLMNGLGLALLVLGLTVHWLALALLLLLAGGRILKNYWIRRRWLPKRNAGATALKRIVALSLLADLATLAGSFDKFRAKINAAPYLRPATKVRSSAEPACHLDETTDAVHNEEMTERSSEPRTAGRDLDAVYICYWSMRDPLCQSQSLTAVRALAKNGRKMGLMTFEQERYRLGKRERAEERDRLVEEGIVWIPLNYHRRPNILATFYDILRGALRVSWLIQRRKVRLVHARGTVPGAIAWLATRVGGARFFYDADGPISEEYADIGIWSRRSLVYRFTRWAEGRFFVGADRVAVLTEAYKNQLPQHSAPIQVLPCAVDLDLFRFDGDDRRTLREKHDWHGPVFVYAGKDFFKISRDLFPDARLLILTREARTSSAPCSTRPNSKMLQAYGQSITRMFPPGYRR